MKVGSIVKPNVPGHEIHNKTGIIEQCSNESAIVVIDGKQWRLPFSRLTLINTFSRGNAVLVAGNSIIDFAAYGHARRPHLAYVEREVTHGLMSSMGSCYWPEFGCANQDDSPPKPFQFWGSRSLNKPHDMYRYSLGLYAVEKNNPAIRACQPKGMVVNTGIIKESNVYCSVLANLKYLHGEEVVPTEYIIPCDELVLDKSFCECESHNLMIQGCKCGAIIEERLRKSAVES